MAFPRLVQPEIMDDPQLDARQHAAALRGLRRIHTWTGTVGRLWRPIEQLIVAQGLRELSVLDVGCGDGWILRQLHRRAARRGCQLRLIGCDFSPRAVEWCRRAGDSLGPPIEVHQVDVTRSGLPEVADVVISCFFLHHFRDPQVISIVANMAAAAGRLVVIEDLVRSRWGYALCCLGVQLFSRCRVVHEDGPLSVRAAFSPAELRALLAAAGLPTANVRRCWPERLVVSCAVAGPALGRVPATTPAENPPHAR